MEIATINLSHEAIKIVDYLRAYVSNLRSCLFVQTSSSAIHLTLLRQSQSMVVSTTNLDDYRPSYRCQGAKNGHVQLFLFIESEFSVEVASTDINFATVIDASRVLTSRVDVNYFLLFVMEPYWFGGEYVFGASY